MTMKHKCARHPPIFGQPDPGWSHDDDPCTCECEDCNEFRRIQALVDIKDIELEQLDKILEGVTPGPWEDSQIKGFGAMNFIVTMSEQSQPRWHRVVAILENAGFDTGRFIAWCHDGVPRLLRMIKSLKKENQELREELDRLKGL